MEFEYVQPIARAEAESKFASGDAKIICDALIRATLHDPDPVWSQTIALRFTAHDDEEVRGLAATCLGHLARIHKSLDLAVVVPILVKLTEDPAVGGRAEDALDDIRTFMESGAA